MKRTKYEERAMGPMFPRLHVNDTERGGPRAPPRNKMALYEQLTIPANRYNPGNMQHNPNSGASQLQGTSNDRIVYFPSYQPPVTRPLPLQSADRLQRHPSDAVNARSLASEAEQRKKPEDEDDFAVPIFSHPGKEQCKNANQSRNEQERCRTFSSSCSLRFPNTCNKETDQVDSDRKDPENEQAAVIVSSSDPPVKFSGDISAREASGGAMQLQKGAVMSDHLDINRTSRLKYTNVDSRYSESCGPMKDAEGRTSSRLKSNSSFRPSNRDDFECEEEGNQRDDSMGGNMDRGNDVPKTTNVATIADSDVSPDAVVDVIGLKHFWRARRAIVNQQRVFAVQVFELHRLIKVQQLIAESPEVLIDASAFLGKSSIKVTPLKNIPSEYTVKALADSNKPKDDSQKSNHNDDNNNKTEGSSENAVAKAPIASPPNLTQHLSHPQFPANPAEQIPPPPPPPMAIPQAGGHQWLVPVMSPSEGLVYKPYPGPGFPGPGCGGCGPHGTTPLPPSHHFMNPNYGVPPSPYYHHHHPGAPFNVQGYFPPYGMSAINSAASGSAVDQINQRSWSNPNGETGQTVIRTPNVSIQQQGSCNKPSQRHSELLGSTGSSPSERAQDIVRPVASRKEKDGFALFPTRVPPPQQREAEQANTVIKVVPHNARTATESAARIFRSIQEERRQNQPN